VARSGDPGDHEAMAGPLRRRWHPRLALLAVLVASTLSVLPAAPTAPSVDALSRWTGGIDLYRRGVFSTQQSWLWCTAADVQIMRNIVHRQADHSRANQSRYFSYMRAHDRYSIPVRDGTEPSGWTAGLRRYVDSRYRLVASTNFDAALRSAVTNLRKTNLPVGLLVAHGNHAWVLTGFTATADPAKTSRFTITSVRVVGPLWGLQSRSYGYDMAPDRKLTPSQLRGFFTPWHYARVRMAWEGRWVSIQGIPGRTSTAAAPKPAASPTPKPKAAASPKPTPRPSPTAVPSASPSASPAADPSSSAAPQVAALVAGSEPPAATAAPAPEPGGTVVRMTWPTWLPIAALSLLLAGVVLLVGLLNARRIRS
jgi:hypothetical protein